MKSILTLLLSLVAYVQVHAADSTQLQILNENLQPVAGADVYIGNVDRNETLKTDVNGMVDIPTSWKASFPVTVTAAGYLKSTFLDVYPTDTTLQLHREDQKGVMEVKGETTDYDNLKKDGKVDFALVYPGLRLRQLAQFDVQSVISPDSDEIKILTETAAVPSNLSLPKQKETYMLPITLEKPVYRMSFKQTGDYRLIAMHGQFPINKVVGDLRAGKAFYEIINHFSIKGGGQKDVTINSSVDGQNIPVNQLKFNKTITVKGVPLPDDQVMFSFSLAKQANIYFPSDVKRILPTDTTQLVLPENSEQNSIVSVIMPKTEASGIGGSAEEDGKAKVDDSVVDPLPQFKNLFDGALRFFNISFEETEMNRGIGGMSSARHNESEPTPLFLGLVGRPTFNDGVITLAQPPLVAGIEPVATYAILSEVERTPKGNYTIERNFRVWEVAQLGWADQLQLPVGTFNFTPGKSYRWDVLFMGRRIGYNNTGEYFLDGVTHVTRNSIDF